MATETPNPSDSKPSLMQRIGSALRPKPSGTTVEVVRVEREPTPEEKAQTKWWLDTLARECELHKDSWRQMRECREAAAGDKKEYLVNVNLHEATLETLLPILYAQDPEVDVRPEESVDESRYGELKPFCRTLEIVTNRELRDAKLEKQAPRVIRAAKVCGFGVAKVMFQTDTEQDPVIRARINDLQDNMQRIAHLAEQVAEGDECTPEDAAKQREDLEQTVKALQEKVEVLRAIGLVLDFVRSDDLVVPHAVGELVDYERAPWIAQRIWMQKESAVEEFGLSKKEADQLTTYACRQSVPGENDREAVDEPSKGRKQELTCCWEVWDHRNQTVLTFIEGLDRYAKEPFSPQFVGERFYPFFVLGFAWVDGRRDPLSAVAMADPLVQEYNGTRSGYREHRENAIPAGVFDKSIMDVEDVERLRKRERIELVGIDANGANVQQALGVLQYPQVDPALYDTSVIRGEIDIIYGVQDAMRGVVMKAKTATEAEIMQQGLGARTTGQRGQLEEWLQEIAQYAAEVLLLAMPAEQVQEIAGAGAVWPELNRSQIYHMVQVEIRAGSTGKPDKEKDLKVWKELLPELMPIIQQYTKALASGQPGIADALKEIVMETFRRFDDRIDPERFLPKIEPQQPQMPGQGGAAELPPEAAAMLAQATQGSPQPTDVGAQ